MQCHLAFSRLVMVVCKSPFPVAWAGQVACTWARTTLCLQADLAWVAQAGQA